MKLVISILLTSVFSVTAFAQQEAEASPDNQCRIQAKEIALQTYQNCVTEYRSAKIDQIRREYQEKLAELKNQYETQLLELKSEAAITTTKNTTPANETVESENLTITQPTITLKPAKQDKKFKKTGQPTGQPVVAKKRAKGEKGVKGIAKTLPAKQKTVATKPVSALSPQTELNELPESSEQATGPTKNLHVVEQELNDSQVSDSSLQ